eukprot:1781559-Pyramimonas_sp.AAC.1
MSSRSPFSHFRVERHPPVQACPAASCGQRLPARLRHLQLARSTPRLRPRVWFDPPADLAMLVQQMR